MTPDEIRLALNVGGVVKVFFDTHNETVIVISADSDGILCQPVTVQSGETAAEFWLAYNQISRVEKVDT
jgi:hypothetical protein